MQRWLQQLQANEPSLVRVVRYGSSAEGRPLYVVKVGMEPDRDRPALWIDANMHGNELVGTNVAVAFVDDLLALHRGENRRGLSAMAAARAKEALVYVVPTLSPDGLEAISEDGRFVRSSPVPPHPSQRPRWRQVDLDGDGQIRRLRIADPCGAFVESRQVQGLMVPRSIDDDGPFYSLYPEGVIDHWDGSHVPPWDIFDDAPLDLNRNFSIGWRPEPDQAGAGDFAGSSPEARAVMQLVTTLPHLYAWVNLHTFGGVWIRPLGDAPDTKLASADRAILGLVEQWATTYAGVPTVSGYEEFTYTPQLPIAGDIVDYAWHQRGAYAWAVELWDLFARAGLPKRGRFVDRYVMQSTSDIEHLARAVAALGGHAIEPWRTVRHPQLGDVEIGGLDPRFSIWNPPPGPLVDEVCRGHSAVFLRMLSLLPVLKVHTTRQRLDGEAFLVEVTVENHGGLPTSGPAVAAKIPHNEPISVIAVDAARVRGPGRVVCGHLGGTQLGYAGDGTTWPYQQTTGLPTRRRVSFVVIGDAPLQLQIGSQRTGFLSHEA